MSIFESLAGLFNDGSKDSQGNQPDVTKKNNDKNLLDNLSEGLSEGWKSITSVFSTPKPDHEQDNARHNDAKSEQILTDKINTAKKAAERARYSALEAQNQINKSRVEHNNQFQNGKLSNPPQAGQKRKELDSEFDQNPSPTKKPRSDSLGRLTPTQLWQQHGIVASSEITAKSLDESINRAKRQSNRIGIEADNQGGHLSLRGNHFSTRDPNVWRGESGLAGRSNPNDRLWHDENLKSLQNSSSESRLTAMREAQEVATELAKSKKAEGKSLVDARLQSGQSRTNVLSGKGGSAGRW